MQSLLTIGGKIESRLLRQLFTEQWVIGACRHSSSHLLGEIGACTLLEPPRGVHYADPFVISIGGQMYVFFEVWRDDHSKGVIQCAMLDQVGHWTEPELVLERPYHLSYPFVFTWCGDLYLLPETRQNKTIELYRAIEFPRRWDLAAVLMDGVDAVDSTLLEFDGQWWMFTAGLGDSWARLRQLSIFHADSPFGPWLPHPRNPVVNNPGTARPAGRLFIDQGQLIRPGQDCRLRYGYAIVWNRVDLLNDFEYRETRLAEFKPKLTSGWVAMHTYNQNGGWEVFDGKRLSRRTVASLGETGE
jgi:hypothetical protein